MIRRFPKNGFRLPLLIFWSFFLSATAFAVTPHTIKLGADLSFVPSLEDDGAVWKDNGVAGDPLDQFAANGWSIIRLRLWHTPNEDGWERYHGLDSTIVYAKRAVAAGHEWMLDFHYSDYWADPGKQWPPAAWEGQDVNFMEDSLYLYTRAVLERCRREGVMPEYVQLGNEIDPGMLWYVGSVQQNTSEQWDNLARLLKAAELGVRHASDGIEPPQIILHLAHGSDFDHVESWLDSVVVRDVPFDVIGFSYYPWWHGGLDLLEESLFYTAYRYAKPIMVVETAYPSTLDWYDSQHNTVGLESQLLPGFPATPAGQMAFFDTLKSIVTNTPGRMGKGLLWWEPAWVPVEGRACSFENLTVYDFEGNSLPVLHQNPVSSIGEAVVALPSNFTVSVWPNPFNGAVSVGVQGDGGVVRLELFDLLGRSVGEWSVRGFNPTRTLDLHALPSGTYLLRTSLGQEYSTRRITLLR